MISKKPMQLGSSNLSYKYSTMSLENPFISVSMSKVKGEDHVSKALLAWIIALF